MKGKRIFFIIASIVAIFVLVMIVLPDGQPSYHGRKLIAWLDELQQHGPGTAEWLAASNAINQIGTNAVPSLLELQSKRDSKIKSAIISRWNPRVDYDFRIRSAEERHMMAWFGFGVLGEKSSPAWSLFIKWTEDRDPEVRQRGITWLRGCRADKTVFIPVASKLLKDPDPLVQLVTATYFRDLYPEEAEAGGIYKQFPQLRVPPATNSSASGKTNSSSAAADKK